MRALAALISRRRMRSPFLTAKPIRHAAVDGHRIADAPIVVDVVPVAEILADFTRFGQPPVAEHPGHVAVDADRFRLLDDQRAIKPAADLLETALVRVIPEGAGVDRVEFVDEASRLARSASA